MSEIISTKKISLVVDWRLRLLVIFICSIATLSALSAVGMIMFYIVYLRGQL